MRELIAALYLSYDITTYLSWETNVILIEFGWVCAIREKGFTSGESSAKEYWVVLSIQFCWSVVLTDGNAPCVASYLHT
jgi:hypothetical protein